MYKIEFFQLARLAVPLIIAQLAQTTLSFVDTLMVGKLGNDALAGIALGGTLFFLVYVIFSGFVLGVSPIVAQAVGGREFARAGRAVRQGLWLSFGLAIPAMIVFWNTQPIFMALGQNPETALDSSQYLQAISWGILPGLGIMALRGFLEGHGDTPPIMMISFVAVGLNVFLNNVLMFGWYGLPALGLVGTGYASALVFTSGFLMLATYVQLRYPQYEIFRRFWFPDFRMLKELLSVGGPIGFTLGFECSMFTAAGVAMGTLGKPELAAHQIALQSASVSFTVAMGLAIASSVRVGQAIGRRSIDEARTAGHVGMMLCVVVMAISGLVFWLFPQIIVGMYIDVLAVENAEVVGLATSFLAIAALFQVMDGLQVSAACALRGLKDTFATMVLTLIAYWGVGGLAGYLFCFVWEWGGIGLWWGMTAGLAAAAVMLVIRFQWRVGQREEAPSIPAAMTVGGR